MLTLVLAQILEFHQYLQMLFDVQHYPKNTMETNQCISKNIYMWKAIVIQ